MKFDMRYYWMGLFALVILGVAACSKPQTAETSKDGENSFFDLEVFKTAAGHEVWLVNEPSIPILSLSFNWPDGHYYDEDAVYGVSDYVSYLMNEGAGDMDVTAFTTQMETLNMSFGCSARALWMSCSVTLLAERLEPSLELVREALHEPRFDIIPIDRKKREDVAGIDRRETDAQYLAGNAFEAVYYADHPLAREYTLDGLTRINRAEIKRRYREIFGQKVVKISAVGAISKTELGPLVDGILEGLSAESPTALPAVDPINFKEVGVADPIVATLPQPQSLVRVMGPGLRRDNPDFYAAILANQIFGGSATSRLFESLRTDKGLTYGVYSSISQSDLWASWNIQGQVRNAKVGEYISALKQEMTKIAGDGATQDELDAARDYLIGSYPLTFDTNGKIAGALSSAQREDLRPEYFNQRNAALSAVTLEDVNAVFDAYLRPSRFTFVVVGEPEGLEQNQSNASQ